MDERVGDYDHRIVDECHHLSARSFELADRSASEAFLFRRLQTLPEMIGLFRLNVELPISVGGAGKMELDLLGVEAGIVIELDGGQHFADAEARRRDRRKDALLEQHGYFVPRLLAEDAGQHRGLVLDTILTALVHREKNRRL